MFEGLTAEERNQLSRFFAPQVIPAEQTVCGEGAGDYGFCLIKRGQAELTRDGSPGQKTLLKAGDFFGEDFMTAEGEGITVTAVTELEILKLVKGAFNRFLEEHPGLNIGSGPAL
jgi:CRP-like cAMP-binding protein